jgi:Tfp pilus assembly protein PilV
MIQQSKIFSKQRHHNHLAKSQQPGFLTAEALVASVIFAIILTGAVKIIERQNSIHLKALAHHRIYSIIAQDTKAIRQYATMWNSRTVDYEKTGELQAEMLYNSSINCIQFKRRGALESAHRSDSFNYNRIFPFSSDINQNNKVISSFTDTSKTTYRITRNYINPSNTPNLEIDPYTIRVKYSVETVDKDNKSTPFPFEHTSDINLIAQYSC